MNALAIAPGLELADGLTLPHDAVTKKLAWIGTTGSGKTYGAMRCAELFWAAGYQFVALDTMGIWWGFRLAADQKSDGIPITIFGGAHGDIEISPGDGGMVAEVVVQTKISCVIDVSEFNTDTEKAHFASEFADRLYRLKKKAPSGIHLFLEEAHEFIPQNPQPGDTMMLHRFNTIWKQGRNYGIGGSIITQQPQDVNKKSLNLSQLVLAFNVTGVTAVEYMQKWMKKVPDSERLTEFDPGQCIAWSPAWLKIAQTVRISKRWTFHASYDASEPFEIHEQPTLAAIDVDALREQFASVQQAEAAAPKEKRSATKGAGAAEPSGSKVQDLERAIEERDRIIAQLGRVLHRTFDIAKAMEGLQSMIGPLPEFAQVLLARPLVGDYQVIDSGVAEPPPGPITRPFRMPKKEPETVAVSVAEKAAVTAKPQPVQLALLERHDGVSRKILEQLARAHPESMAPEVLAKKVGKAASGGHFRGIVRRLAAEGLIDKDGVRLKASMRLVSGGKK